MIWTKKYENANPVQVFLIKRFFSTVASMVIQSGADQICDVGCGEGYIRAYLQSHFPELHIQGIDIDLNELEQGKRINPPIASNSLLQADIMHLPYPGRVFNLVLCLEVLEHLQYPQNGLEELTRISDKYLILSVPHEPFFRLMNFMRGRNLRQWGNDPGHIQHFSINTFRSLITKHRLRILDIKYPYPWLCILAEK